jgi:hypothetical protein
VKTQSRPEATVDWGLGGSAHAHGCLIRSGWSAGNLAVHSKASGNARLMPECTMPTPMRPYNERRYLCVSNRGNSAPVSLSPNSWAIATRRARIDTRCPPAGHIRPRDPGRGQSPADLARDVGALDLDESRGSRLCVDPGRSDGSCDRRHDAFPAAATPRPASGCGRRARGQPRWRARSLRRRGGLCPCPDPR